MFPLLSRTTIASLALAGGVLVAPFAALAHPAGASAKRPQTADVERDLAALAQQRPWKCAASPSAAPGGRLLGQVDLCAWQNRLRMQRWTIAAAPQDAACVSAPALSWFRARTLAGAPAGLPLAWRSHWTVQSMQGDNGTEAFIVIIKRLPDAQWSVTEWRWKPSPRAATRRWQAGRWALLAERAAQSRQREQAAAGPREARMLRAVIEGNLARRAGETAGDVWRWEADGLCLRADLPGLGPQQLQLPYAVDDSRLEQRAAMQLHLARRFPKATWLTTFRLVPQTPQAKGGAKFYAIWTEDKLLKGQLWIPTKGDGPLVRVRIDTDLPAAGAGQQQGTERAAAVIERELAALAARWSNAYE